MSKEKRKYNIQLPDIPMHGGPWDGRTVNCPANYYITAEGARYRLSTEDQCYYYVEGT